MLAQKTWPIVSRRGTNRVQRLAALIVIGLGLMAAACSGAVTPPLGTPAATAQPSAPGIEHPTGATELVFRYETVGGFLAPNARLTEYPAISIYGDGTMITPGPQIAIYPGPTLPNLVSTKLTEAGLQKLLALAANAGLVGPDGKFDAIGIADAGTAQFTVIAGGRVHRVTAYALGESIDEQGLAPGVREARVRLRSFLTTLDNLPAALGADAVTPGQPYVFTDIRVFVNPGAPQNEGLPAPKVIAWPLSMPLSTFGGPLPDQAPGQLPLIRCGVVSGDDLATLRPALRAANQASPWSSGNQLFTLSVRVLLPDESGCASGD